MLKEVLRWFLLLVDLISCEIHFVTCDVCLYVVCCVLVSLILNNAKCCLFIV